MQDTRQKQRASTAVILTILSILILAAPLGLAACGSTTSTTQSSSTTPTDTATLPSTSDTTNPPVSQEVSGLPLAYGPWQEPPYLGPQSVDLSAVVNLSRAELPEKVKEVLARQSFVAVAPSLDQSWPWKFWHVYEIHRYRGLPPLVTTDSFLNAYHELFDALLQYLEETRLFDQAVAMTDALYAAASAQYNEAADPVVKEDARLNMAYFAVAASLLKGQLAAPDLVRDEVEAELGLIEAASDVVESRVLGYKEDYTQYKPRGHYTRSERLKRYFKTLMWFGHTAFYINPHSGGVSPEEAVSLTRRAVLAALALSGPAKQSWSAIYEPTSFLVGRSDDLTADEVLAATAKVYGTAEVQPDQLADQGKIDLLRAELNKLRAPKILTAAREASDPGSREKSERSFRIMGQRYIPDSYAFQQLVWPYVGEEPDKKRDLPMGLDVMTVLGSDQAYRIAKEDFGQDHFLNWEEQIKKVHDEFASQDPDLWPANLYTGWLEALQHVMNFPAEGAPDFMKTRVWARKSLNAALGSWTELRHDTILYAKQSVTAEGDGGEEDVPAGYVEPYPAFFAQMGELASTLHSQLVKYGLLDSVFASKLETIIWLAEILKSAAQKELAGTPLTTEEETAIAEYGHYLEYLGQFEDSALEGTGEGRTLSLVPEKSPLVADVHSSYNTSRALEEATGYPLTLYAAIEREGKVWLFAGASYSYYEFTVPLDQRLTDEEWIKLLDDGQAPPRPAWTNEWILE